MAASQPWQKGFMRTREGFITIPFADPDSWNGSRSNSIAYEPISKWCTVLYGMSLSYRGAPTESSELLEKAVEKNPGKTLLYTTAGQLRTDQALEAFGFSQLAACRNPNTGNIVRLWGLAPKSANGAQPNTSSFRGAEFPGCCGLRRINSKRTLFDQVMRRYDRVSGMVVSTTIGSKSVKLTGKGFVPAVATSRETLWVKVLHAA